MPQIMKSQMISACLYQLSEVLLDHLIALRNNKVLVTLMRHRLNQTQQIRRKNKLPRGLIGLVDIADNILCIQIQLAPSDRQNAVFEIAEL